MPLEQGGIAWNAAVKQSSISERNEQIRLSLACFRVDATWHREGLYILVENDMMRNSYFKPFRTYLYKEHGFQLVYPSVIVTPRITRSHHRGNYRLYCRVQCLDAGSSCGDQVSLKAWGSGGQI